MILVAVVHLIVLLCPASIAVLLAPYNGVWIKPCGAHSFFDLYILSTSVPFAWSDNTGVDNTTFFSQHALPLKQLTETLKDLATPVATVLLY